MFFRSLAARMAGFFALALLPLFTLAAEASAEALTELPPAWQTRWTSPPNEDRPLKIEHTLIERDLNKKGLAVFTKHGMGGPDGIPAFLEYHLGGVVTNVSLRDYLRSEERWGDFSKMIDLLAEKEQVIWIYDEDGYPSMAAGGRVLEGHPEFEALELLYCSRKSGDDAFAVRRSYEHTHASNNYYAYRRYPNLLDAEACRRFLEVTHEAYKKHVGKHFGKTIHAMFTDEPSLIAVNLGPLPEKVRNKIRVADPLSSKVELLPVVPWSRDLPAAYQARYGEDLLKDRKSLFVGDSERDFLVRRRFWSLIAERVAENYFGQIQKWCHANHLLSSGHLLYEESIVHHVPLYGNALESIEKMDIPGMDQLSSEPQSVVWASWLTAAMPSSAAMLGGKRRVMTEVSDFAESMADKGHVSLDKMCATAAWQAAWGVTDFTLYYTLNKRSVEDVRAYSDFVGRLNAVLKPAKIDRDVLLYYPIDSLWEVYQPVREKLHLNTQNARAQMIGNSFFKTGQKLQQSQVPFTLIDYRNLDRTEVQGDCLTLAGHAYHAIVVPAGTKLGEAEAKKLDALRASGGTVVKLGTPEADKELVSLIDRERRLTPHDKFLTYGRFERDGRTIHLLVNTGEKSFSGHLRPMKKVEKVLVIDPATGKSQSRDLQNGLVSVELKSFETILVVE